jgi:hypothetical protein
MGGREVEVTNATGLSHKIPDRPHTKAEYRKFDERRRALRAEAYAKEVAALKAIDSGLPGRKSPRRK